jgi:hypothetical protein
MTWTSSPRIRARRDDGARGDARVKGPTPIRAAVEPMMKARDFDLQCRRRARDVRHREILVTRRELHDHDEQHEWRAGDREREVPYDLEEDRRPLKCETGLSMRRTVVL